VHAPAADARRGMLLANKQFRPPFETGLQLRHVNH
jgi:hypothetical protein